jgi:hypothetical protein
MSANRRPRLVLIGTLGLVAGSSLLAGCDDDTTVSVERASYATQASCEQDWSRPNDCVFVPDATQPASSASNTTGSTAGHASGHWYGPYYTRTGKVYHSDGSEDEETINTRNAVSTTTQTVSEHALASGEAGEVSRGGFGESANGGEAGGHGGGEGGHGG